MKLSALTLARYKILTVIIGAIVIAIVLTIISVSLYVRSGVASLDLSRPGYEQAIEQVEPSRANYNFEANGPVNEASLQEFKELYQSELKQLQGSSDFSDQILEDSQLRFTPETQDDPTGQ